MNVKAIALGVALLPFHAFASVCADMDGFTAPVDQSVPSEPYFFKTAAICLNGQDISGKFKQYPDDVITGAFSMHNGDGNHFFASVYSEKNNYARIYFLNYAAGRATALVIFQNQPGKFGDEPKKSMANLSINFYDDKTSTLYFSTDAWAQARALHVLTWSDPGNIGAPSESFLHDGTFEGVYKGMPIVSTIRHDDKGAYFPAYLLRSDGTEFCAVDTRRQIWQLSPKCLEPGDDYRER
ncbi:hypothetical protein [Pantoea ananatis]|uniref:hypothetical protein n=1 Tax=Pantoea ananas TaxID=553 RepID=UPI001B315C78|nr:hypothetical protein [Pantoea ananatis]